MLTRLDILQYGIYNIMFQPDYEHLNRDNLNSKIILEAKQVARLSNATHKIECVTIEDGLNQLHEKAKLFWELSNIGREPEKPSFGIEPELRKERNKP